MSATQWSCSSRCWQEGGPHDESCHIIGEYETEVVIADDGYPSIVIKRPASPDTEGAE